MSGPDPVLEFRLHGRGGQGGVTCAKILAAVHARTGKSVQTFGDYAGERSGAPVRAYTRVSDAPITIRNKVYEPDHVLVLDPTLLGAGVVAGLAPGGTLLVNTPDSPAEVAARFPGFRIAAVDATAIARQHKIGTRSVVIVNTTLAGAFCKVMRHPLELLEAVYADLGLLSNLDAAKEAYQAVQVHEMSYLEAAQADETEGAASTDGKPVVPLTEHVESQPTGLQTGSWRTQRPQYVEKLAPCSAWCPAGNDVIGFIQAIAGPGETAAAEILGRTTPLAGVCGRVCPAPCMEGCNRREYDGEVNIRGLERWVADSLPVAQKQVQTCKDPKRIAIVGGGPAGLGAAYSLALAGHAVTILEGEPELGGVLRTGIPEYRLPREVVDDEIGAVLALGVEPRCGEFLEREALGRLSEEYDALIVATGLQKLRKLDVPGTDLAGVVQGIRFLHELNMAQRRELHGHVVVLGGGNTAMDCARSALRCGAERVTVAYRRTRLEMPAIREEIEEAEQEGVALLLQRQPVAFHGSGRVQGVELAEVEMGEPDETGRRRPVVTDRTSRLDCDFVLLALGQSADLSLVPQDWELRGERFHRHGEPLNAFGAGDLATGDGTVTHAIGSGRRAAGLVQQALGLEVEVFNRPDRRRAVPVTDIRLDHFSRREPAREQVEPPQNRMHHFGEVNYGLRDAWEAHRCFSCGSCTQCDTCLVYCPEGIIRRQRPGYEVDYTYCKGCGICVVECPRSAIEMT